MSSDHPWTGDLQDFSFENSLPLELSLSAGYGAYTPVLLTSVQSHVFLSRQFPLQTLQVYGKAVYPIT